jgi:hypothetical protein
MKNNKFAGKLTLNKSTIVDLCKEEKNEVKGGGIDTRSIILSCVQSYCGVLTEAPCCDF